MMDGTGFGFGGMGAIFWVLLFLVLAALIKYLFTGWK